jgi:hypothetical protein
MPEERVESLGFYEMLWDCDHCDSKGLLAASQRYCPVCGAKQNAALRYMPKEGEERRVDGHKYAGADRACPSCSSPQSAQAHNCTHCGASLDGAAKVKGLTAQATATERAPKKRRWWILWLVLALIALAGVGIWYRFLRKRSATMTVTAHRWERVIPIEEFGEFSDQAWRDRVPRDARMVTCRPKKRSTKKVEDGEECHTEKQDRKDGTFEMVKKCAPKYREEPVEDDWCSFRVLRWRELKEAALRASGTGMQPTSPTGAPPSNASATLGARRALAERQTLILDFGKQHCDVSEAVWRKYQDGAAVKVLVVASSGDIVCDSL